MSKPETIDSKDIESLWKEFDESELDKLDLSKRSLCIKLIDMVEESKKQDLKKELLFLNFAFGIKGTFTYKEVDIEWYKHNVQRFRELCNKDTLEYYKERFNQTPSFLNKAHYAFACWLATYEHDYLTQFVSNMIESIKLLAYERNYMEIFQRVMLTCNVARFYQLRKFNVMFNDTLLKIIYDTNNTKDA